MLPRFLLAVALLWTAPQQAAHQPDAVTALVTRLEEALGAADRAALDALADAAAALELTNGLTTPAPTRFVLKERDRTAIDGGHRLLLEIFAEVGPEGRLSTWSVDVAAAAGGLRILSATRLAYVGGLYRLALDPSKQFEVKDLTIQAPDLALHVSTGSAFVADTRDGTTALVVLGRGEMRFSPPDPAEQTQVRIFSGAEILRVGFDAAFIRIRPEDFAARVPSGALTSRAVSAADLRRARAVAEDYLGKTLSIDLADLSRERWSITPQFGDFIAEVRTDKFGSLTYTRAGSEAEDITLFNRARRRNISVYASREKLAQRGRFYSEDDLVDFDILAHDIDASISPDRLWIDGNARLKIRVRSGAAATLSLKLAESLAIRRVHSPELGRLLHLRVVGQNSFIISLPATVTRGTEFWINVVYGGRVVSQELDREAITVGQQDRQEAMLIAPEPRFLYSHRAYWYPQAAVSDYATARLTITAPAEFEVVATGTQLGPPGPPPGVRDERQRPQRTFVFECVRPVRYLAFVVSRFRHVDTRDVGGVELRSEANPRQVGKARGYAARTEEIFSFYRSLVGRAPYPSFTVAYTEREAPGGHSPPYFAVVDQVIYNPGVTFRNDPVNFDSYPAFFLAHEVAHQWWGQAVGWKNYHEQWISEGFAQYFALLYAEQKLKRGVSAAVLRQMRDTAIDESAQGPVYLGYRLGHIKGDSTIFRSIVYNKAAMVLHMLRRLVGDDAFFKGVRDFYDKWEFKKAGTGDFIATMEAASGRPLGPFFDAWIFGPSIPSVKFTHRLDNGEVILRFEQAADPVEMAITVTLTDDGGETTDVLVPLAGKVTEHRVPVKSRPRTVVANSDHGALAVIVR